MAHSYRQIVLQHTQFIKSLENNLRSLSYFLPGKAGSTTRILRLKLAFIFFSLFSLDTKVLPVLVHAFVDIAALYHDHVLNNEKPLFSQNDFNKYSLKTLSSNTKYRIIAYSLAIIRYIELVVEMFARKFGDRNAQMKIITIIEALKYRKEMLTCKIALLRLHHNRMLLQTSVPIRIDKGLHIGDPDENAVWKATRTGKVYPKISNIINSAETPAPDAMASLMSGTPLRKNDNTIEFLLKKALVASPKTPLELVGELSGVRLIGEWIFILRPLIYVLALRKYGMRDDLTKLEIDEIGRRVLLLCTYILRNPFYDQFTKSRIDRVIEITSSKPLISLFSAMLKEYKPLWEDYHFYVSSQY
ncbi:Peroxisomal membrane protein pex16 [Nowakowskiella sp. JEL0078]|nr:Peroxisomal membrane protein pex16 [Nowakowskiella sp. JEL0078]